MKKNFLALAICGLLLTGCVTTGSIKPAVQQVPGVKCEDVTSYKSQIEKQTKQVSKLQAEVKAQAKAKNGARLFMFVYFLLALAAVYFPNAKVTVKVRGLLEKVLTFVKSEKVKLFFSNLIAKIKSLFVKK